MLIEDNKIEELLQKELKEQVEKKLKTFGREAIMQVYADSIKIATSNFLKENEKLLEQEIRQNIQFDTTVWKQDIVESFSNKLMGTISDVLRNDDTFDRY